LPTKKTLMKYNNIVSYIENKKLMIVHLFMWDKKKRWIWL